DGGLCSLVKESKEVGKALAVALDQRRDAITGADLEASISGSDDGSADKKRAAYDEALRTLSGTLPGVFVSEGAAVRFGPDYASLADAAHSPPARRLLQQAGALLGGNSSLTFHEAKAPRSCRDLAPAVVVVQALAKVW